MLETKYIILFITLIIFAVVIVGLVIYISSEQPQPVTVTPPLPSPVTVTPPLPSPVTVTPPLPSPVTVTPSSLPPAPTIPSPVIFPAPIPEPATNVLSTPAIVGIVIGIILILVRLLFYLKPGSYYKWFGMSDTEWNIRRVASSPVRLASKVVALPVETVLKVPVKLTQIAFRPFEWKFIRDTVQSYVRVLKLDQPNNNNIENIQNIQNIKKALYFLTWYSTKDIYYMYDIIYSKNTYTNTLTKVLSISKRKDELSKSKLEISMNGKDITVDLKNLKLFPWTSIFKKSVFNAWYILALYGHGSQEKIDTLGSKINYIISKIKWIQDIIINKNNIHHIDYSNHNVLTNNAQTIVSFINLYNTQTGFFKDWLLKFKLMDF